MAAAENRPEAGFTLIEILVSMLVLTVGLLGLVGMQVVAQRAELESYQRAQAMVLLNDIVDRINTNRKAIACYAVTPSAGTTNLIGASGTGHYDTSVISCPSLATNPGAVARAKLDLQLIEAMLLGASETTGAGASVGAMIGARACIGFDSTTQAYTVALAWQGMSKTFSPASWPVGANPAVARNCAVNLYGATGADDSQRRVIWTTLMVASLT